MQTRGLYKEDTVLHGIFYKTQCSHIVTYTNPSSSNDEQGKKTRTLFDVRHNWVSRTRKVMNIYSVQRDVTPLNYPPDPRGTCIRRAP